MERIGIMNLPGGDASDAAELHRLIPCLHRILDDADSHHEQALGRIYAPEATLRSSRGQAVGLQQIVRYIRETANPEELSRHYATDILTDGVGDEARITANVVAYYFRQRILLRTAGLQYALTATRTSAGWRIVDAEVTLDWLQQAAPPSKN